MVEIHEGLGVPLRVHNLLLALSGRLDDTALSEAREHLARSRIDESAELVAGTLIAGRTPVRTEEQRDLAFVLEVSRSDATLADGLTVDDLAPAPAHRFSGAGQPESGVADALERPLRVLPDLRAVRAVWRNTPAGSVPGPMPQRVVLVEIGPEGHPPAVAYRLGTALRRSSIPAVVEVSGPEAAWGRYQEDALAVAVNVWLAATSPASAESAPAPVAEPTPTVAAEPAPEVSASSQGAALFAKPAGVPAVNLRSAPEASQDAGPEASMATGPAPHAVTSLVANPALVSQPLTAVGTSGRTASTVAGVDETEVAPSLPEASAARGWRSIPAEKTGRAQHSAGQARAVPVTVESPAAESEPEITEPVAEPFSDSEQEVTAEPEPATTEQREPAQESTAEQPHRAENTADMTSAEVAQLRQALAEDPAKGKAIASGEMSGSGHDVQSEVVDLPALDLDDPQLSERDRRLLRELHAELADRERAEAAQASTNGQRSGNGQTSQSGGTEGFSA